MGSFRRRRRGFTIVEVVAASVIFLVMAAGITSAVAQSMALRATASAKDHLTAEMTKLLDEVATTPFTALLDDDFTVPDACAGADGIGQRGTSCLEYNRRTYELDWSISFPSDEVVAATDAASYADVVVSTALPDGTPIARSRRVEAPTFAYTGDAVVRVQVSGAAEDTTAVESLYLLDAADPDVVHATATVQLGASALFRVPASTCSSVSPCVVGLASGANWTSNGSVALSPSSTIGSSSQIVLTASEVHQVGVEVFAPAQLSVRLLAATDAGVEAAPPASAQSTVCLWAYFNDGVAQRLVPGCNDDDPTIISFDTYPYDPLDTSKRIPVPPVPMLLLVDHPNGSCPNVGQYGAVAGAFEQTAVCTSWTWGVPGALRVAEVDTPYGTASTLSPGTNLFEMVFSGDLARPAAGYAGQPLWSNPREAGVCAASASCTSILDTTPEQSLCPGEQCLSARVPTYVGPLVDTTPAVLLTSSSTAFSIAVDDFGDDPVTVEVRTVPAAGTLWFDGAPVTANQVLGTTDGSPSSFALVFDDPAIPVSLVSFTVRLSNLVPNGVRDVDVALFRGDPIWTFESTPVTVEQNDSATVSFEAFAPGPTPSANTVVSLSASPELTVPASVTTDENGVASFTVAAGDVPAGQYAIAAVSAEGQSLTIPVDVLQAPAAVSMSQPDDIPQAGSTTVTVTVVDRVGAAMAADQVVFTTGATGFATGVRTSPASCTTAIDGTCTVTVLADRAAASGVYALTATTGAASASALFSVQSVPWSVSADPVTVQQDDTSSLSVTVVDGAGSAYPGEPVSVTSAPSGVSVTPASQVAGIDGVAVFTVTASPTAATGDGTIVFSVGSNVTPVPVTVRATPSAMVADASVEMLLSTAKVVTVSVTDTAGDPVANVQVVTDAGAGVAAEPALTDASGVARVALVASSAAAKGSRTVTLSLSQYPSVTTTLTATVQGAPASVSIVGTIPIGGVGTFAALVSDEAGDPVSGATVSITELPSAVSLAPSSVSGADGQAPFTVYELGVLDPGVYRARVQVAYLGIAKTVSVVVPAAVTSSTTVSPATPAQPTVSSVTSSAAEISWSAPVSNGGAPITEYRIYQDATLVGASASTTWTLSSLSPSTRYAVQVAACNAIGCSPVSAAAYPVTLPAPVADLAAVAAGNQSVTLTWSLAADALSSLSVQYQPTGAASWTSYPVPTNAVSATLTGLDAGVEYTFVVVAATAAGTATSASVTALAVTRPAVPLPVSLTTISGSQRQVSWTPPSSVLPITSFQVYRDGVLLAVVSSSPYVDTPPSMAVSYRYQVRACTTLGCSAASAATMS